MEKVDQWFNSMINRYKNGDKEAFYYYPMGALKEKIAKKHLERPENVTVSQWLCQLLSVGELTDSDLRFALYETLAERHVTKIESPFFLKRMLYYNDLNTSSIKTSKEDLIEHPEHLIRYIRTLNTTERGYLRWAVKKNQEIIKELLQRVLEKWNESDEAVGESDD